MGLKFVNKGSVVVDCYAARHNGMQWTLVNNHAMERIDCQNGIAVVDKLRRACPSVRVHLDELYREKEPELDKVKDPELPKEKGSELPKVSEPVMYQVERVEEPKKDACRTSVCYVSREDAPALLNMLDASAHILDWRAERNDMLSSDERCVIRIEYKADRQLLFQEGDKVVFRDEDPATQSSTAHEGKEA